MSDEECAICRNDITGTCNKTTTVCGHSFHFTCLSRSMNTSPRCPICRTLLVANDSRRGDAGGENEMKDDSPESDDDDDDEDQEEGEVRLPRRGRREVIVTELRDSSISDNHVFGNEVDLRREILEGIIHSMCRQGDLNETRSLLNDSPQLQYSRGSTGDLLTHDAVLSDNESLLSYLLNDKAFDANLPNDVHTYPLHYAVLSGSMRMVTILLNHRAFVDCADGSRKTPLMLACEEEDHDITELLLDRGASTLTQDAAGNNPIHFAVRSRSQACLRRLVSAEADVNAVNHMQETPLLIACKLGFHGVSRNLLRAGADPEKANKFGTTPLDEAASNGSSSLVDLLRGYV